MKVISLVVLLLLAGCSSIPSSPIEVQVPISIPCKIQLPVKPNFSTNMLGIGEDIFTQVKSLLAERKQRQGYELELEAAIESCNK